jgi:hypothetical protein
MNKLTAEVKFYFTEIQKKVQSVSPQAADGSPVLLHCHVYWSLPFALNPPRDGIVNSFSLVNVITICFLKSK